MKNKYLKLVGTIFAVIILWFSLYIISNGASFSASISKTTVNVGDTFTVTVKASNAAGMYSVSASNSNVTVSSGSTSEFLENDSTTVTYKATKAGSVTITASASDMTDLDDDTKQVTGSKTFNVTIKSSSSSSGSGSSSSSGSSSGSGSNSSSSQSAPTFTKKDETVYATDSVNVRSSYSTSSSVIGSLDVGDSIKRTGLATKAVNGVTWSRVSYNGRTAYVSSSYLTTEKPEESNNKDLKSLSVGDSFELTPAFSADVTEYTLTVGEDVTSLDIKAVADDENAKVEITGNANLLMGENTVEIKVTAEDGTVRTYTINVTKGDTAAIAENSISLETLSVDGYTLSPEFSKNIYEYTLDIPDTNVTSLNVNAMSDTDDTSIEIIGNNNLQLGENVITILVKSADGNEVATYQVIANIHEPEKTQIIAGIDDEDLFLYGGVAIVALVVIIIIAVVAVKHRKNNEDDYETYYGGFTPLNSNVDSNQKDKVKKNKSNVLDEISDKKPEKIATDEETEPKKEDKKVSISDEKEERRRNVIEKNFGVDIVTDNFDDDQPKRKRGKHF